MVITKAPRKLARVVQGVGTCLLAALLVNCGGSSGKDSSPDDGNNGNPAGGSSVVYRVTLGSGITPGNASKAESFVEIGNPPPPLVDMIPFRKVDKGTFTFGTSASDDISSVMSTLRSKVTINYSYYVSIFEITQGQWKRMTGTDPWATMDVTSLGGSFAVDNSKPAFGLSYNQVMAGIDGYNMANPNARVRLLTDVEWEYACRAGSTSTFNWGGNHGDESRPTVIYAHTVVRETAAGVEGVQSTGRRINDAQLELFRNTNPYGLVDMHGNAWEYVSGVNAQGEAELRGGSWNDNLLSARSASKVKIHADRPYGTAGIRLALITE